MCQPEVLTPNWQEYPQCLPQHAFDPYLYDLESLHDLLEADANRLFVPEDDTAVQVLEAEGKHGAAGPLHVV